jgi:hypothetical protein
MCCYYGYPTVTRGTVKTSTRAPSHKPVGCSTVKLVIGRRSFHFPLLHDDDDDDDDD